VFVGGAGNDTMIGGLGNDVYNVDAVNDVMIESAGEGDDTVFTSVTYTISANVESLVLNGTANIGGTGNAGANALTGNTGNNALNGGDGNDTLRGGGGADTMTGGLGNDVFAVDSADDQIVELAGGGTDTVVSSISYILGSELENLTLSGAAVIDATGNALANVLTGNGAANVLSGGLGNDTLRGGLGADTFVFDTALNAATNVDTIGDFVSGDHMQLSGAIFTALTPGGALAAGQFFSGPGLTGSTGAVGQGAGIYYDTTTGSMYYDADGAGGAAGLKFAVVTGHPALLPTDLIVGP
jgi:Ca2+-binding RTX toxin-like protein